MMNTAVVLGTVALAVIGVVSGVFAILKFVYKRGGDERASTTATRENTEAVKELASSLRDFKDYTVASLHDLAISHERAVARIEVIETKLRNKS